MPPVRRPNTTDGRPASSARSGMPSPLTSPGPATDQPALSVQGGNGGGSPDSKFAASQASWSPLAAPSMRRNAFATSTSPPRRRPVTTHAAPRPPCSGAPTITSASPSPSTSPTPAADDRRGPRMAIPRLPRRRTSTVRVPRRPNTTYADPRLASTTSSRRSPLTSPAIMRACGVARGGAGDPEAARAAQRARRALAPEDDAHAVVREQDVGDAVAVHVAGARRIGRRHGRGRPRGRPITRARRRARIRQACRSRAARQSGNGPEVSRRIEV